MAPETHPLNRDFVWTSPRGPFRRLSTEQVRCYDEQGYCIVEDALTPELVHAVTAEIDPWEEKVESLIAAQPGKKLFIARAGEISFTMHLVRRSALLRTFCGSPLFQDLCHDLVGPDVRLYWDQAVYKKPGTKDEFPWHQDNGYNYVEPQNYLTVWVALTDATRDNGCPWVVPGLHRRGTLRHEMTPLGWRCLDDAQGAVPCELRAGCLVAFSSLTPHATGPNRSDAVRKAYIPQFAPEGARVVAPGGADTATMSELCDAPERQFPILVGGRAPR
jgi:ectoine hydroxylase-related dioxygenase (phytanoyl-CoA dioxygenase family)